MISLSKHTTVSLLWPQASVPCFLMAQESNKHFVQTEKPALLSEDREVRETRRRPFTDHKRDTQHKADLGREGGRA